MTLSMSLHINQPLVLECTRLCYTCWDVAAGLSSNKWKPNRQEKTSSELKNNVEVCYVGLNTRQGLVSDLTTVDWCDSESCIVSVQVYMYVHLCVLLLKCTNTHTHTVFLCTNRNCKCNQSCSPRLHQYAILNINRCWRRCDLHLPAQLLSNQNTNSAVIEAKCLLSGPWLVPCSRLARCQFWASFHPSSRLTYRQTSTTATSYYVINLLLYV